MVVTFHVLSGNATDTSKYMLLTDGFHYSGKPSWLTLPMTWLSTCVQHFQLSHPKCFSWSGKKCKLS